MKVYEVTTVKINLNTLDNETITAIWREDEMLAIKKPRKLFKTVVAWAYCDDEENCFKNMTVTRIR